MKKDKRPAWSWATMQPGDEVVLEYWYRLESIAVDDDFQISSSRNDSYCLCIGRCENKTVSGLTTLKIYMLTPMGVGYRRLNVVHPDPYTV